MIPVGPAISNLLSQSPFDQIAIDTLYEDDAPHGRPTIYFLAAMTTYMAMYGEPTPSSYQVPAIIDPIVANNYQQAIDFLWNELQNFQTPSGESRVFCQSSASLEMNEKSELHVYPNPFETKLTVNSELPIDHVELLDASGRVLIYTAQSTLDVSTLRSGAYFCRVILTNGSVSVKKVMKD
ncbi:MAG: T9SS type A sorting domain-containing protein [Crocinitomicaceae bacterium]